MEEYERLRMFSIFSELDAANLGAVGRITESRRCAAGEKVMTEGAPADFLYLVAEGRVAVKIREPDGTEDQIDELGPGEVLGWGAVVAPHVYTASAWAAGPSEFILISGSALRDLCDANKELGHTVFTKIGEVMSARLGSMMRGRGIDELHRFKFLKDLDLGELDAIGRISRVREYQKGDLLATEGAAADNLYLFLKGKAEVKVRDPDGRHVLIDQIGPGDVLGWSAAMEPYIYTASAWASEPSEAIVVNGPRLRDLCNCEKNLGYKITKEIGEIISRRFGRVIGVLDDLRAKDMRAFDGPERVIWEDGTLQLTTEAVLIGMATDAPEVIPLEALQNVDVVDGQVVFRMASGDVWSPALRDAGEVAALTRDAMARTRFAQRRKDYYLS